MNFLLLLLFILFVSSLLNTFVFVNSTEHLCHPDQRDVLLEFKNEFEIQKPAFVDSEVSCYRKTDSWVIKSSDCCSWDGITCDAISGEVIGLDLSFSCLHGRFESDSSLFRLSHVRDLNLAYNNFTASSIPTEFDKLKEIQRLNLSKSSFSGQIPTNLLQLTKLVSLDLSFSSMNPYQNSLSVDKSFLSLLSQNLRNLRELDLSFVNISSEIPQEFSNMWSLRSLHLIGCNLFGEFPSSVLLIPNLESIRLSTNPKLRGKFPDFHGNTNNSLQILSLSQTSFYGVIPESIRNLKHLRSLSLFESNFSGKIPISLGNLSHLSYLSLAYNNLNGEIPSSIGKLNQLTDLDVRNNELSGNLPSSIVNMTKLRYINLCFNQFTGFLPSNISQLSKLEEFYACENSFVGVIPSSLYNIPSLTTIYLNDNQFTNLVGFENISLLLNLRYLFLNDNNFSLMVTPIDLNFFLPLRQLQILSLSGIPLSKTNSTFDSSFLSNLVNLNLSGCNISEFPEFIRNQRNLISLNLSNNKIKGQVPDWLWRLKGLIVLDLSSNSFTGFSNGSLEASHESKIYLLDLSSNAFQGPIFMPSPFVHYFFASKNNFTGEISGSICGLISPDILDLSKNNLHGSIPRCLEAQMASLSDLNLANNRLSGSLPDIFINAKSLKSLDVSYNRLEGQLPASLTGCSALEVLNVGNNRINDMFPFKLNSLQKLQVLVLRSNKFHGMLHQSDSVWSGFPQLKIIDVSYNNFRGVLPSDYFLNWTAMSSKSDNNMMEPDYIRGLYGYYTSLVLMSKGVSMEMERILTIYTAIDFSGNKLQGNIPGSIGLLKELRILNISSNAFVGNIPSSLANLTNLESLDLSENKLTGEIPPELGTLSSLSWINISHNELVGSIPQGTQFQRQDCSSYLGNPGLYGPSLKDVCRDIYSATPPQLEPVETEEEDEETLSWIAAGIGFAPGVIFGLTIGYIVASYKHEWFMKTFTRSKQY